MSWSDAYFLEVSAHVSVKVGTKDYFRDKETVKSYSLRSCFQSKNGGVQPKKSKFL